MFNIGNRAIFVVIILVLLMGSCIRSCIIDDNNRERDAKNGTPAKAVIIDKKIYWSKSPTPNKFSYLYRFKVDGEFFTGDSGRSDLQIDDTVDVAYLKTNPNVNWPVKK